MGSVLDAGSAYELRALGLVSAGASARMGERVAVSGQLDYVHYSEIRSTLLIRRGAYQRKDYVLADAFESRLGVEASFPMRGGSLQARAGLHGQAGGALAYQGADAVEAAAFPGAERRLLVSGGASVVTRSLRLDVSAVFGSGTNRVLLGGAVRF